MFNITKKNRQHKSGIKFITRHVKDKTLRKQLQIRFWKGLEEIASHANEFYKPIINENIKLTDENIKNKEMINKLNNSHHNYKTGIRDRDDAVNNEYKELNKELNNKNKKLTNDKEELMNKNKKSNNVIKNFCIILNKYHEF